MNVYERSMALHESVRGKIGTELKVTVDSQEDLALAYSPGVAEPCRVIHRDPAAANHLTLKGNTIAVISDGSAVLGLGNIGAKAAIPVMEGKAVLFKRFAGLNAFPICLETQDTDEIVETIRRIAPVFGGINLEDISAPRCFEVEARLQDLGIPVFHDDQHGTAIVTLAGIINAVKVTRRKFADLRVVMNGAGAAGVAIAKMLRGVGFDGEIIPVHDIVMCDTKGAIHRDRTDLNESKLEILTFTNREHKRGSLKDVIKGADVFIGVSSGNLLTAADIRTMAPNPIIFAMANPEPEIMPEEAYRGGAAVMGTGRSDFPNQVNNVLAFPGIFKGALEAGATQITPRMKMAAAYALAAMVTVPTRDRIIPHSLEPGVCEVVAEAVKKAAQTPK